MLCARAQTMGKTLSARKLIETMKILLDHYFIRMERLLTDSCHQVTTSTDLNYSENADEDYIKYAKEHDMIFVTEDGKAAKIAQFLGVEHIHLDINMKTRAVLDELEKR